MDIYEYFKNNFQLFTQEKYKDCELSYNTKKILCEIGLPEEPLNFIQFNIKSIENIRLGEEYIIIGNDYGTSICVNLKDEIVSVDPNHEYPPRYINKNLEIFLKFISIFLAYADKMIDANDTEIYLIMKAMKTEFNIVDIHALSNEENWWSIILEQIELGLM